MTLIVKDQGKRRKIRQTAERCKRFKHCLDSAREKADEFVYLGKSYENMASSK